MSAKKLPAFYRINKKNNACCPLENLSLFQSRATLLDSRDAFRYGRPIGTEGLASGLSHARSVSQEGTSRARQFPQYRESNSANNRLRLSTASRNEKINCIALCVYLHVLAGLQSCGTAVNLDRVTCW